MLLGFFVVFAVDISAICSAFAGCTWLLLNYAALA
jgi:hypothetical protein